MEQFELGGVSTWNLITCSISVHQRVAKGELNEIAYFKPGLQAARALWLPSNGDRDSIEYPTVTVRKEIHGFQRNSEGF